jgi:large subunit ribosomal protein L6
MSRVGKKPIIIPDKTKVIFKDRIVTVEGEQGRLARTIPSLVNLKIEQGLIQVSVIKDDRKSRALQGLTRSLVANMIMGVDKGFEKILQINGIGYRASVDGNSIIFNVGYSHAVNFSIPEGIKVSIDKSNVIRLSGIDKELVSHIASRIRQLRPPEPYKGKGIKYTDERILRKAGKSGAK